MKTLSNSLDAIKDHYDAVVIGSGYGGGVAASRLARAGKSVCVLERGREYKPGEFPKTLSEATEALQVDTHIEKVGSPTGLFNLHINNQLSVLVGCGLGGTSLINASVSLKADPRVFTNGKWPADLLADLHDGLEKGYARALDMLAPTPYPDHYPALPKLNAQKKSAGFIGEAFYKTPINVTFEDKINAVGVEQKACTNCGDCVSGCNYTAKNTTQMNYLPDARNHGAEIYTECSVSHISREKDKWLVYFQPVGVGRERFSPPLLFVSANYVVVSAGTLGSTELMLRSRANGLSLSEKLGQRFSGNGDVLGFAYACSQPIDGIGAGHRNPAGMPPCGPCITSVIDTRRSAADYRNGLVIEEVAIPGALAATLPAAFASAAGLIGNDTQHGLLHKLKDTGERVLSLVEGAYRGAINRTQTYLIMSQDEDSGVMALNENDKLTIDWQGAGNEPVIAKANAALSQCSTALGGTYIDDPIWTKLFRNSLISVHPLGGCIMGNNVVEGVVNHKGQVFDPSTGGVHAGLYITDGSIIPTTLGVNPLLTITAISERNMALMIADNGWSVDYTFPAAVRPATVTKPGIRFTETMKGYFSVYGTAGSPKEFDGCQEDNSPVSFTLTIQSDDVARMIGEPDYNASMVGTVLIPCLSPEPMTAIGGTFNLFIDDSQKVNIKRMTYATSLKDVYGTRYFFEGFKQINEDNGLRVWHESSTLYITLYKGASNQGEVIGKGILQVEPADFLQQMTTMAAINTSSAAESLETIARFGKFFAGALFDVYGNVLKKDRYFNPGAPARRKRPLRVGAPDVHTFQTADLVTLRLTRYQGGRKGPVICSHGLGVASSIFSTDLIATNLLEYLYAHEYDVWLLDYRASIDLPASQTEFSGDDIARYDYPAAVDTVRAITGAKDVQMMVHCYGSTTFTMAMLNGLQGVRSAVCSQISTHFNAPSLTQIKAGLHVPAFLEHPGMKSLTAYVDTDANWFNRLCDDAMKLTTMPYHAYCNNPVCHRITFMYSLLYQHEQLNQALHDNLHELFGAGTIESFRHLALMIRKGHITNATGDDTYLPHSERMAIPILFLSGENNGCYPPESTARTYQFLCDANGSQFYSRKVIPGYGHIDCIFGQNAVNDVYPSILAHLEQTN